MNSTTTGVVAITSADGKSTITVQSQSLSLTGAAITITKGFTISSQAQAVSATGRLETSIANVNKALASLGTGSKSLEIQNTFNTKLSDALKIGIGNLVDADLATESARLQALQVQQQLGIQALGIANQAPGAILALFR